MNVQKSATMIRDANHFHTVRRLINALPQPWSRLQIVHTSKVSLASTYISKKKSATQMEDSGVKVMGPVQFVGKL